MWGHPTLCGMGGKSEMKVHTIWLFSNFHFRSCYYAFWLRRPPGTSSLLSLFKSPFPHGNLTWKFFLFYPTCAFCMMGSYASLSVCLSFHLSHYTIILVTWLCGDLYYRPVVYVVALSRSPTKAGGLTSTSSCIFCHYFKTFLIRCKAGKD